MPTTISFAPVTARHFRLVVPPRPQPDLSILMSLPQGLDMTALGAMLPEAPQGLQVAELRLNADERIDQFEAKAGFAMAMDYYALESDLPDSPPPGSPAEPIDLTTRVAADGTLEWTPPPGHWRVIRMGYTLTGRTNHPATAEATGLEVDKLDAAAVRRYLDHYLGLYRTATGKDRLVDGGLRAILTDSTEVGPFNWTADMVAQFRRLRGYDPRPWLPALSGSIVGSRRQSDAFLYDFRRTIAELHASAHYGTIAQVARENGLKVYGEALETGRNTLGDDMAMRRHADFPMAAMWFMRREAAGKAGFLADMKGAASVAHIYGQNLVAAESMTSAVAPWAYAPNELRRIIDLEFASGVNRPVVHTSVHQPVDDKVPGLSLAIFGQYFNRHEAWAELARPWVDYMARSSLLLRWSGLAGFLSLETLKAHRETLYSLVSGSIVMARNTNGSSWTPRATSAHGTRPTRASTIVVHEIESTSPKVAISAAIQAAIDMATVVETRTPPNRNAVESSMPET